MVAAASVAVGRASGAAEPKSEEQSSPPLPPSPPRPSPLPSVAVAPALTAAAALTAGAAAANATAATAAIAVAVAAAVAVTRNRRCRPVYQGDQGGDQGNLGDPGRHTRSAHSVARRLRAACRRGPRLSRRSHQVPARAPTHPLLLSGSPTVAAARGAPLARQPPGEPLTARVCGASRRGHTIGCSIFALGYLFITLPKPTALVRIFVRILAEAQGMRTGYGQGGVNKNNKGLDPLTSV